MEIAPLRTRLSKASPAAITLTLALSFSSISPAAPPAPPAAAPAKPKPKTVARVVKPQVPPRYTQYVKTWHTPTAGKAPSLDEAGRPLLALMSLNTNDRIELPAMSDRGGFTATALDRAAFVLREPSSGNEHPIEPRLLDAIYRIQSHFRAQEVRVISAYRTPRHGGGSNHGKGRAIDLVIPGASDEDVAKFAREQGFSGVGIYPSSGFVHVDVRERSYFWVDTSGPGRKTRERGVLGDLAQKSDVLAASRGERPVPSFSVGVDVDAALRARAALPSLLPALTEEDDDDLE